MNKILLVVLLFLLVHPVLAMGEEPDVFITLSEGQENFYIFTSAGQDQLRAVASYLEANPDVCIEVESWSSDEGYKSPYNDADPRAHDYSRGYGRFSSAIQTLVGFGVERSRITPRFSAIRAPKSGVAIYYRRCGHAATDTAGISSAELQRIQGELAEKVGEADFDSYTSDWYERNKPAIMEDLQAQPDDPDDKKRTRFYSVGWRTLNVSGVPHGDFSGIGGGIKWKSPVDWLSGVFKVSGDPFTNRQQWDAISSLGFTVHLSERVGLNFAGLAASEFLDPGFRKPIYLQKIYGGFTGFTLSLGPLDIQTGIGKGRFRGPHNLRIKWHWFWQLGVSFTSRKS